MKRIFRKFKEKIRFNKEDLPPPYQENDAAAPGPVGVDEERAEVLEESSEPFDVLDLLANCNIEPIPSPSSENSYAEIEEIEPIMGIWHSTPLSKRHKSKISLTWVLRENLENTKAIERPTRAVQNEYLNQRQLESGLKKERTWQQKENFEITKEIERNKRVLQNEYLNQRLLSNSLKKEHPNGRLKKERVVGRNEQILKCKSVSDLVESLTDSSAEERRRRHRHRKKKRPRSSGKFGYDINDLDCFLNEASIDRPGNIPLVIAQPATLYQTQFGDSCALPLPAGAVVNAVFQSKQWVYAQTAHGQEGYVPRAACLPLPILPTRQSPQKKTPCWESSTDIYPRPCGNLTDTEKEQLRGRTRSECRYRPKSEKRRVAKSCAEEEFDSLYLKSRSYSSNIDKLYDHRLKKPSVYDSHRLKKDSVRHTLLVVNSDYNGLDRTLSVSKGEVVTLIHGRKETDVDSEWFYVRKRDGVQGFIPAAVAGHGYI